MKRITKTLMVFLTSIMIFTCGGCVERGSSSEQPPLEKSEPYFNLERWEYLVYVGDSQLTIVQAFGLNEPILYESSDPDIVAMGDKPYNATTIFAKKAGEVTITVRYGYFVDTIKVVSTFGDMKPSLNFKGDVRDSNFINEDEEFDLSFNILFNKKQFEPTRRAYEIKSDGQVVTDATAKIENGKFIAKKGLYEVKVLGEWSNYEGDGLEKTVTLRVDV